MNFDGHISLCELEIEWIRKEGDRGRQLLKIRMDTIYANLGICLRHGYETREQKEKYQTVRASFFALQTEKGIFYDNDDL